MKKRNVLCCTFLFLYTMNATELFFDTIRKGFNDRLEAQIVNNPEIVSTKDTRGFTPLIFATYFDNKEASEILLKHKAEVDAKDASGNTALIGVSFKGNLHITEILLNHSADINATNNTGVTALIFATMYNQQAVVQLLLKHSADKSSKDDSGKTALDYANEKGFKELEELLK